MHLGSYKLRRCLWYAASHIDAISETWNSNLQPNDVRTAYGQAKRAAEHMCFLYSDYYGIDVVVARCFSFVGPDLPRDVHYAIGNFIRDALSSDTITVNGDGTPLRTYLNQEDLACWLFQILLRSNSGMIYNVGSDEVISIADLAHLVRDILSPSKPVRILSNPNLSAPRNIYVPDVTKAHRDLNLQVSINLAESIRLCVS